MKTSESNASKLPSKLMTACYNNNFDLVSSIIKNEVSMNLIKI